MTDDQIAKEIERLSKQARGKAIVEYFDNLYSRERRGEDSPHQSITAMSKGMNSAINKELQKN